MESGGMGSSYGGATQGVGGFATQSAVWDQGAPAAPRTSVAREDVKGVAEAIMRRGGTGSLNVDQMPRFLQGTPYADFASWFDGAVDMEGATHLSIQQLEAVVGQYLAESAESNVGQALNAGGAAESPFMEGSTGYGSQTPNELAAGTKGGDLVSFIQSSKASPDRARKRSGRVLLHMMVEIGDGRSDTIDVREGDDPRELADAFCRFHELSVNVVEPLSEHIKANVAGIKVPLSAPKQDQAPQEMSKSMKAKVDGEAVGRRLSQTPTRAPRMTMDPSRLMMPALSGLGQEEDPQEGVDFADHLDELNMSPQTTNAVRKSAGTRLLSKSKAKAFSPALAQKQTDVANRARPHRTSNGDVFSRLNREAEERRRRQDEAIEKRITEENHEIEDQIQREKLLNGSAGAKETKPRRNIGQDLFDRATEKERQLKKKIEDKKVEEEARERKEFEARGVMKGKDGKPLKDKDGKAIPLYPAGKPKINKRSGVQSRVMKDWDGAERKKRLEEARKKQLEDELSDCTFDIRAKISSTREMGYGNRSAKLVAKLEGEAPEEDRFEALYMDAKQRQLRTEQYENWFPDDQTFHPDIGENRYRPTTDATEAEFIDRLTYSKQMTPAAELEDRDVMTGQPLFHPRTGRAPMFQRNAADLPIGDYLYASGLEQEDEKMRRQLEHESLVEESVNRPKASFNSQLLTEGMRRRRLREIFEMVDQNGDGIIDPESANRAGVEGLLPETVANELIPVVIGVAQPLDFEQFYQLVSTEISYTQTGPRDFLVPERLRHLRALEDYIMDKEGAPYQPKVSMKSRVLAQNQRKHRHGSLHESLSEEGQIWDERRRNASEQKAAEDLAQCTFQPNAHLNRVTDRGAPNPHVVTRRLTQPSKRI